MCSGICNITENQFYIDTLIRTHTNNTVVYEFMCNLKEEKHSFSHLNNSLGSHGLHQPTHKSHFPFKYSITLSLTLVVSSTSPNPHTTFSSSLLTKLNSKKYVE